MTTLHHQSPRPLPDRHSAYQIQRQKNRRMALALGSIAVAFFVGFIAKMALL